MAETVIQPFVGKLVEYIVDVIKNQVKYLCCYSCNVQALVEEVGELNIKRQSVQQDIDAAMANSDGVIRLEVEAWLKKVEELQSRSDKVCGDAQRKSVCKWFPLLHYSLSRKALKIAEDSVQLRNTKFDKIFNPVIPADISPIPTTWSNVGFASRDSIEIEIVDALKDLSVYSIGIWGIGGVGKTVLANKIEKRVRDEMIFKRVILIVVSQQLDVPKIQSQIAEGLGLSLSEQSLVLRQRKIHRRLMAEKDILIILDDLWERLDLEEIGIPSQSTHTSCKLILTSRNQDALTSTGIPIQNIFELKILTKEESWRFFIDNSGINIDDNDMLQIAKKVERECMGLPLALKIVAGALKGKDKSFWNNAARELEKCVPDNIPGVTKHVYGTLLFSINALEGKEQKDIFLLCCLFPEDYYISSEELLRCGIGLGIFGESENLIEARNKVETILNILLSRSLLIEGSKKLDNFNVRIHDIIRDVGIWIEKHVFLIKHGVNEWPIVEEDSPNNYTCISLLFSHHSISFPDPESMVFPNVEFLRLDFVQRRFTNYHVVLPKNLLSGMSRLRVLEASHIQLLPPSMSELTNLRTLSLQDCNIFETASMLGKLINLEMLSLKYCELEVFPKEIGSLKKLKQMNICHCRSLTRIAFGVISQLARLEELVILESFDNWGVEGRGDEDVAFFSELNALKNLTNLRIEIRDPSVVPRQKPLWVQELKTYDLTLSKQTFGLYRKERFQKAIILDDEQENPLGDWIYNLASGADFAILLGSSCMRFFKQLSNYSGNLRCLKQLNLHDFSGTQYLVEGIQSSAIFPILEYLLIKNSKSLQQIFEASPPTGSFAELQRICLFRLPKLVCLWKSEQLYLGNLQSIDIYACHSLSHLFPLSVAQSLVQLTDLIVRFCDAMKEIFEKEEGQSLEINEIKLPKLCKIKFSNLFSFRRLCNEIDRIDLPELSSLKLCSLQSIKMKEGDNDKAHLIPKVNGHSFNFFALKMLKVEDIENIKCMFSPSVIASELPNLTLLRIIDCTMLEQVIGKDDEHIEGKQIIFPNLESLNLENLPSIRSFCDNAIQFPSLIYLRISQCPLMFKFVEELNHHNSNSKSGPFLEKQVDCPMLKMLVLEDLNISQVFSPQFFKSLTLLEGFHLWLCEELECIITKGESAATNTNTELEFIRMVPLKSFSLIKLPKLYGSIFQIEHSLEFPFLIEIEIKDRPMLENFTLGSLHMPNLRGLTGFLNSESATKFFFHKDKEMEDNSGTIISASDISFNLDLDASDGLFLCPSDSRKSFLDVVSIPLIIDFVGTFKIEKIETGIEYEVILMIMLLKEYEWEDPIEIELKLHEETKLLGTQILENYPVGTWIEISIGKFLGKSQQNQQLEFFVRYLQSVVHSYRQVSIKGIKVVEI